MRGAVSLTVFWPCVTISKSRGWHNRKGCSIMKYVLSVILVASFFVCGFGGPTPDAQENNAQAPGTLLIDNFESGNLVNPEWWKFDNVALTVVDNSAYQVGDEIALKEIAKYSLNIKGKAANWYAGGCGTYLAKPKTDYSQFGVLQLDIYGNGPGSGTLQIELYDDDNANWQVEQDPKKNYVPIYDDKFQYQVTVNWKGWKRVAIPFADFEDVNPGVGDDIWNPDQKGGSGGLLQIQLIALGPKKTGDINYNLDNIMLVK